MAVSEVEICNLALASFGHTIQIESLDEASEEARQCKLHLPHARRSLLMDPGYDWSFARKRISLAQETTNELSDAWAYCYAMPEKFLKVRWLEPQPLPNLSAPYQIDLGKFYCNESPAYLRYIEDVEDVSVFPQQFVDALAVRLASRIVYPITKDAGLRKEAIDLDRMIVSSADASDSNNDYQAEQSSTSILDARR